MNIAFIIDPLETLKPSKDSSLDLMLEASRRGHRVSILEPTQLSMVDGQVMFETCEVIVSPNLLTVPKASSGIKAVGTAKATPAATFDVVFIRKDPPFDSQYLALTYVLDKLPSKTLCVNSPKGLRSINEKLTAARFRGYTPSTLVTWSLAEARTFAKSFPRVVLKHSALGSGKSVFLSSHQDPNLDSIFNTILSTEPCGPVIVQEYLREGVDGDIRVMLLDGQPLAALGRRPAEGDFRANIAQGGTAVAAHLTPRQSSIATEIGAELREEGIIFAGLDFIGDKLIEINVTSPTLIQELRRIDGFDMSQKIFDFIERRTTV